MGKRLIKKKYIPEEYHKNQICKRKNKPQSTNQNQKKKRKEKIQKSHCRTYDNLTKTFDSKIENPTAIDERAKDLQFEYYFF